MQKIILITGSTDGIGLEAAKLLVSLGHHVLIHGRNPSKGKQVESELRALPGGGEVSAFTADLSDRREVEELAKAVAATVPRLDGLINNAGVFKVASSMTKDGLDVRFAVNTVAPYLLTQRLLPLLGSSARVINLSSAAQAPVDLKALAGQVALSDGAAYAQSKLALTMWSRSLALSCQETGPVVVAVNPGSMLATKMVKQAYGVSGADIGIGADILRRAVLADEFGAASGQYFDNDSGRFAEPHPDALDIRKCQEVVSAVEAILHRSSPA